jgi:Reverse transcriptase (RNA-dependent DNA polymerase)
MLEGRIVTAKLGEEHVTIRTTKGCSQGDVLSTSLRSLGINKLLTNLEQQGFEVIDFVDDLVIIIWEKVKSVLNERLQATLNYATEW